MLLFCEKPRFWRRKLRGLLHSKRWRADIVVTDHHVPRNHLRLILLRTIQLRLFGEIILICRSLVRDVLRVFASTGLRRWNIYFKRIPLEVHHLSQAASRTTSQFGRIDHHAHPASVVGGQRVLMVHQAASLFRRLLP